MEITKKRGCWDKVLQMCEMTCSENCNCLHMTGNREEGEEEKEVGEAESQDGALRPSYDSSGKPCPRLQA